MLLNYKKRKNEKGFAIALALLMLVAMSLMGASLMVIAASDHKQNGNLNIKQQSFYAAETGITEAKKWLSTQSALTIGSDPSNQLSFCKTSLFPELSNPKAVKDYIEKKDLSELIVGESKLTDYSYEYFITYTPDANGNTQNAITSTVSGATGGDISQGTSYKNTGTSTATYYNVYSCGCDANKNSCNSDSNVITALQSTITLTN
tara:strand:+ start:500 stop:1114 length:615 start_codon:yes stop_codon:yes gene_type:complete